MRQLFIDEPYLWLQSCFFRPAQFRQEFEIQSLTQRLILILRLVPLLFLYSYPLALIVRILLYSVHPDFYPDYGITALFPFHAGVGWFLFEATWASLLSCLAAGLIGSAFSLRFGIATALALSLASGIIVHTGDDVFVGIVFGIAFGVILGITFNSANAVKQGGIENVTIASFLGVGVGLVIGGLTGTLGGYWAGFTLGTMYPALQDAPDSFLGSVLGLALGGTTAILIASLLGWFLRRFSSRRKAAISAGIRVSIAVATAFGLTLGIPVGDAGVSHYTLPIGVGVGVQEEVISGTAFLFFYLLCYYRLPLYPISAYSTIQAYLASKRTKHNALYYLKNSSLHWDECVFLPLPYLKSMLLIAAEQSLDETLSEIHYILQDRPQQRKAAQTTTYELALRDLQQRVGLRDISGAHQQLSLLLPQEVRVLNAKAENVFRLLEDASREAASYISQTNKQDRQSALERMTDDLKKIHTRIAFGSPSLDTHLTSVVNQWKMLAAQGKDTLESVSSSLYIENPYAPGNPLELRDSLFVGRDDITQKLGQALQKKYRPTFLLTGERRMGKSSIIRQLPVLLGPRYLPVFYDLQAPGILASTAAFFSSIADGIAKQFQERGLSIHKLERSQLDEAQQRDDVAVYALFEQWLQEVEHLLEQSDRLVILAFDEFEKLEDAEVRGSINLKLLFDLFRSIIQNSSRLAILFSGAKMVGDMGRSWAGYFVNVERIKVSFLRDKDAYGLIVNPVPNVFNEEVTQEIMHVTHAHPFLIQAVCKQIIEDLNYTSRDMATMQDVTFAIKEVFESWTGYFWDLWDRCDMDQRNCLLILHTHKNVDLDQIVQIGGLNSQNAFHALEKLQMRDIVSFNQSIYSITVPILAQWIEQNLRSLQSSAHDE